MYCAIVVVTDFSFADAVYTERYMGTPTENSDSYKVSITQASWITNNPFKLLHNSDLRHNFMFLTEFLSDRQSKELQNSGLSFGSWHSRWYVSSKYSYFQLLSMRLVIGVLGNT